MKKLVLLFVIACIVTYVSQSAVYNPNLQNSKKAIQPEYYVTIEPNDGNGISKIFPIYRVPEEFLLKQAIHIKTKNLVSFDKLFSRIHLGSVSEILSKYNVSKIRAPFLENIQDSPLNSDNIGIERIFEVYFANEIDPYEVCKELMNSPDVEYATPIYIRQIFDFTPNDPSIGSQWYINNIQLPKAWDYTKGDKSIVIAIIDSGVDWQHPDLNANIWTNPKEIPDNNIDDDGNGKVDDIRGWDFVGNVTSQDLMSGNYREDNNPTNIQGYHGTHVAGLASAVTNNNVGIASPGFSCSILPIKCSPDQGGMGIFRGYEAIVYASKLGAKVINCSWGGPGFSPAEQDIINFALEKGSLVVVAAGNDGAFIDYGGQYPAGYDNVLCVGASNSSNQVASFSNWGVKVTVYAPGQSIYSTMPNNSYSSQNGTSMASPIVSGVAGLVASLHKEWTPKQILHQIRSTSDNVLTSDPNRRPYYYGKINAYKAVYYNAPSRPNVPGVEIIEYKFAQGTAITDYSPKVLQLKVKNFLGPSGNVVLKIRPMNNFLTLSQSEFSLGSLTTLAEKDVNLTVALLENNPWYSGNAFLLCTFESSEYVDYQILSIPIKMNSENKLTKVFTLPDAYKPTWFGASSPQSDCLWAVGQGGMFGTYSGFVLVRSGTTSANYISSQSIYCIYGFNSTTAIAGSGSQNQTTAYIYKTINSGQTWTSLNVSSITGFINAIYFFDQNEGIFLGDPKNGNWGIGRTTDGGATWQPVLGVPLPNSGETGFVNSTARWNDYLWFGTNSGRIFYSSNRGKNWSFSTISNATIVSYITFRDSLYGMAIYRETNDATAPAYLAITTDGGKSWKTRQYNFTQNGYVPIYLFTPENSKVMYVLCAGGQIFGTSDLGNTWNSILNEFTGVVETGTNVVINKSLVRLWQVGLSVSYLDFALEPLTVKKEIQLTSESSLNYDTVSIGSNKLKYVSIKNTGNTSAMLSARIDTIVSNADEFKLFGSVANSIPPGEEIQVRVRFIPKQEGLRTAKLIIESDAEPNQIQIDLIGYGKKQISTVESQKHNFNLFPNPANNFLFVNIPNFDEDPELTIVDAFGNEFLRKKLSELDFVSGKYFVNLEGINSGIYFVRIISKSNVISSKFIKM
ncbi:MAG: S8 family serine peptidase [Ignavibacteria bacterium]|nr:S8 family serine peptidase [Ignavibacteria bacterium]